MKTPLQALPAPSTSRGLRMLPSLAASALLLTACPGDDSMQNVDDSSDTGGTTTTTVPPPQDSTTTETPPGTTTSTTETPDDTSSSTSEASSSGEASTGDLPGSGYGDCLNDEMACTPNEICLNDGIVGVCSEQDCGSVDDCDVPLTGDANAQCVDVDRNGSQECILDCSMGQMCPDGMVCAFDFACLWELIAPGGGQCPDLDAGMAIPQMLMGDNTGLFDDVIQSCGGGGGEDSLYQFTAPADDTYVIDTNGTAFDTTLSILDTCGGAELACNDDVAMVLTSELSLDMMMGQSVIIVVDSFDGEIGPFNLNIAPFVPGACPDQDLSAVVPQTVMGDNTGLVDDHEPSCAPGGEDSLYQFTAPAPGTYVFNTAGTGYDTVLSVLDSCGGAELACNDDSGGAVTSEISIDLMMGQVVIVAVEGFDGGAGPFDLNVTML